MGARNEHFLETACKKIPSEMEVAPHYKLLTLLTLLTLSILYTLLGLRGTRRTRGLRGLRRMRGMRKLRRLRGLTQRWLTGLIWLLSYG